eukprot:g5376.t1
MPPKGRNKKLAKKGFDWKDTERFDKTSSEVGGALDNLESQLRQLKAEIRADEEGIFDFNAHLGLLRKEKILLETRLKENKEWAAKFDERIGPFEKMYEKLTDGIEDIYENAKRKHKLGIDVLVREFQYHPLWKLSDDGFTATPFKPT